MSLSYKVFNCMYFNPCPMPRSTGALTTQVQCLGVENKQRKHFVGNGITAKLPVTSKWKHGRWQIIASPLQHYSFPSSEMQNNEQCRPSTINYGKMNSKYLIFKQKRLHVCSCGNTGWLHIHNKSVSKTLNMLVLLQIIYSAMPVLKNMTEIHVFIIFVAIFSFLKEIQMIDRKDSGYISKYEWATILWRNYVSNDISLLMYFDIRLWEVIIGICIQSNLSFYDIVLDKLKSTGIMSQ